MVETVVTWAVTAWAVGKLVGAAFAVLIVVLWALLMLVGLFGKYQLRKRRAKK